MKLDYDGVADVLYVWLGEPREAYCIEPAEGTLLRVEPNSGDLVGLTIIHFRRRLEKMGESHALSIPLAPDDLMPAVMRQWHLQEAA